MSHKTDIRNVTASVFKYLDDNFAGIVHYPGTEEPGSDAAWIEPWVSVTMKPARGRDWLYRVVLTINIFQKRSEAATYAIGLIAGELAELLKAHRLDVMTYHLDPALAIIGTISFDEPEVLDLGEVKSGEKARIGLRQFTLRCDGRIYPMAA